MFDFDVKAGVVYVKPYRNEFRIDERGRVMLLMEEARDLSRGLRSVTTWPPEDPNSAENEDG